MVSANGPTNCFLSCKGDLVDFIKRSKDDNISDEDRLVIK